MALLTELKRRNVFRVAALYGAIAWLLLQVGDVIVEPLGLPSWTMKLLIVLIAIGFVIALVVAWAYELTPEGLVRESEMTTARRSRLSTGRKLDFAVIAALALALAYFIVNRSDEPPDEARSGGTTLAVLPFASMSGDPDDGFFADGLSEELLNLLAGVDGLRVPGRTSSFYFKGRNEDLREIGRQLNVAHILEGSVRRSGSRVRITAQLVDAADGYHRWSGTYDRELTDVLNLQDEIAGAVTDALKLQLLGSKSAPDPAQRRVDPDAYRYALVAASKFRERGLANLQSAVELYDRAIQKDRNYAKAYAGKAGALMLLYGNHGVGDAKEVVAEAGRNARRALELDPKSSEAHVAAGMHARMQAIVEGMGESAEARRHLEQAVALDPRSTVALYWLGVLEQDRNPERALELFNKALELDPLEFMAATQKAETLSNMGRGDESHAEYERLLKLYPDSSGLLGNYVKNEISWGRLDHALELIDNHPGDGSEHLEDLTAGAVEAALGNKDAARQRFERITGGPLADWIRETMLAGLAGDYERVFAIDTRAAPDVPQARRGALYSALLAGHPDVAARMAREDLPWLFSVPPEMPIGDLCDVAYVAVALRRSGDAETASRIVASALEQWRRVPGLQQPGHVACRAGLIGLSGDMDKSIAELTRAVGMGFRGIGLPLPIPFTSDPLLRELGDDPRLAQIVQRIETDLARQRQLVTQRRALPDKGEPIKEKAASN